MNTEVTEYFNESNNKNLLLAIAENRMEEAWSEINSHQRKGLTLVNSFKKSDPVITTAASILSAKKTKNFFDGRLLLNLEDTKQLSELIKLLLALYLNGNLAIRADAFSDQILTLLNGLVNKVIVGAGNYPNTSIMGNIWIGGIWLRECCDLLAGCFEVVKNEHGKLKALEYKCQITLAVMSHYPHLVGPDMVAAAEANEANGNVKRAKQMYCAVIADIQSVADEIAESDEEEIQSTHIYSLEALACAYKNLIRINGTGECLPILNKINTLIKDIYTRKQE